MYRKYYSYNDMPKIIKQEEKKPEPAVCKEATPEKKLPWKFDADDVILAIVILAILLDDKDDNLLLIALAVVFLSGAV